MRDLYIPEAGNWINALEAGQQAGMTRRKDQATERAGSLMTSGDYRGAAAEIAPFDPRTGIALRGIGQQEEATQRKAAYGATLAGGKPEQAVKDAYAGGDFDVAKELREQIDAATEQQKKAVHEKATRVAEIVAPLGEIPETDMAARKAYIAQHHDDLLGAGYTEQQIASFEPTNQNLVPIWTQAMGLKEYVERTAPKVVGPSLVRTPLMGGKPEVIYESENYQIVPEGGKAIPKHGRVMGGAEEAAPGPAGSAQAPTDGVYGQVGQIAAARGAQPAEVTYLQRLAQVESSGDRNARNGSSMGLFQFHPATFEAAGGGDINSPDDQTAAALNLSRRDRAQLQKLGIEPTDANVYIMHQQGPSGGPALLTAPHEVNAVAALTPAYKGDARIATQAIVANGGTPEMTAGEFVDMWRQRWAAGGRTGGQGRAPSATSSAQPGDPPGTIYGPPKAASTNAPSGYRWAGDKLEAIPGGPGDPAVRAMGTGSRREFASLRKEFTSLDEVKKFKGTSSAYNQIRALASKPNPTSADDMALTYAFMRANDPDSVVRESEFAMVAKTAGLPDQVVIALDKLTKGQVLTPVIRKQLVEAAATMVLQRRKAYDAQARNYRAIAADLGADPDQLAEDPSAWQGRIQRPGAPAPKAGPAAAKPGAAKPAHKMTDAEIKAALGQ